RIHCSLPPLRSEGGTASFSTTLHFPAPALHRPQSRPHAWCALNAAERTALRAAAHILVSIDEESVTWATIWPARKASDRRGSAWTSMHRRRVMRLRWATNDRPAQK